jgi:diguanylate cyclase (GGDEF)-like protein
MRLAFSGFYLALGRWSARPTSLTFARVRIFFFLLIPGLFYFGSCMLMRQYHADQEILVGYSFLPFLLVGLLAVFPLTLIEGVGAALTVGAFLLISESVCGTLLTLPTLSDFWLLGLLAAIALWAELTQLHMLLRLYREATRDPLTRLVNRRVMNRWLINEIVRARADGKPLSVLLFDLDLFKRINDTHGHLSGDAVLRAFSELLQREANTPFISRYGGEEFLAILPGLDAKNSKVVAERIRKACHATKVWAGDGTIIPFTTSVGVTELENGDTAESLIGRVTLAQ